MPACRASCSATSRSAIPAASRTNPTRRRFTLDLALKVLESAVGPRTTVQSPLRWSDDGDWKHDYNNIARMPPEEIAKRRAEFDKVKQVARSQREKLAGVRARGSCDDEQDPSPA